MISSKNQESLILEKIRRMSFVLLGNYHDAWDLTQEVSLELEKGRGKWEQANSKWAWAMGVFHRQFKRFLRIRDQKTHPLSEELYVRENTPEQKAILTEQVQKTFETIGKLNKETAEALLLFSIEKMSIKEIAQIQNAPEGTIKWRIFEARRHLAETKKKSLGEER